MRLLESRSQSDDPLSHFVDREEPLADFERRLGWQPDTPSKVVVYHGVGGVGKTTLRNVAIERLLKPNGVPFAVVDFDFDTEARSAEKTFSRLRRQLGNFGLRFPTFDFVWARHFEVTTGQKVSQSFVPPELQDAANIVALIPLLGNLPQALASLTNMSKSAVSWLTQRFKGGWTNQLLQMNARELLNEMPAAMARDIEEAMTNPKHRGKDGQFRITVIFDGYERLNEQDLDDWWVREFCAECGLALKVICGRDEVHWEQHNLKWKQWLDHFQPPLGNLSPQDADDYLRQWGVDDAALRDYLVNLTDGFPYHLHLAADLCAELEANTGREPNVEDFTGAERAKDLGNELLERLLRQLKHDERDAVLLAAIPRWFTQEVLEVLLSAPESAPRLFKRLPSFSFCEPVPNIPDAYALRKEPRKLLLARARTLSHWQTWQERLRDYHRQKAEEAEGSVKFLHQVEQAYHWLAVEPLTAMEFVEELFDAHNEAFRIHECRLLLNVVQESLTGDPRIEARAKLLESRTWGIDVVEHLSGGKHWERSLGYCEEGIEIAKRTDDSSVLLRLLLQRARLLRHLQRFGKSLETYEECLTLAERLEDRWAKAVTLRDVAEMRYTRNAHLWDEDYLREALTIFCQLNDYNRASYTLGALSWAYRERGDLERAWSFVKEKEDLARQMDNRQHLADTYAYMGDIKRELGGFEEALGYYEEALSLCKETGSTGGRCRVIREIGVLWSQQGQYERALTYLREALELETQLGSQWGVGRALFELARCYTAMKDYPRALEHLLVARTIFQKIEHTEIKLAEALLAQICDELGQEQFDQMVSEVDISQSEYAEFFR